MTFIHFLTGKSSGILSGISSGILFGILSGIFSSICSGISSGILSGKSSGTLSGISSGILFGISSGLKLGLAMTTMTPTRPSQRRRLTSPLHEMDGTDEEEEIPETPVESELHLRWHQHPWHKLYGMKWEMEWTRWNNKWLSWAWAWRHVWTVSSIPWRTMSSKLRSWNTWSRPTLAPPGPTPMLNNWRSMIMSSQLWNCNLMPWNTEWLTEPRCSEDFGTWRSPGIGLFAWSNAMAHSKVARDEWANACGNLHEGRCVWWVAFCQISEHIWTWHGGGFVQECQHTSWWPSGLGNRGPSCASSCSQIVPARTPLAAWAVRLCEKGDVCGWHIWAVGHRWQGCCEGGGCEQGHSSNMGWWLGRMARTAGQPGDSRPLLQEQGHRGKTRERRWEE